MRKLATQWSDYSIIIFDRLLAAAGLVVLSPLICVAAIAILSEDGWPVLFRQNRVARGGFQFRLWKLRSMRLAQGGPRITAANDPRLLRVGKIIRKYKIDELPQLWNVVIGDMSMVGPRPEVPEFVDLEDPVWRRVLSVLPGITDPASLAYRNEEQLLSGVATPETFYRTHILPGKLALNVRYIEQRSLLVNIGLIATTIKAVAIGGRARSNG